MELMGVVKREVSAATMFHIMAAPISLLMPTPPYYVKPILRSDEEKELRVTSARGQRKMVVKNFSQTFVKNAFYFL